MDHLPPFSRAKIIDYRNAKYQGMVNGSNRRHGMGIVVDDDLNLYFSEWQDGKMDGLTIVFLSNGSYIYGCWKNN